MIRYHVEFMAKIKIFIDARCLVRDNPSGVGHYMSSLLRAIDSQLDELNAPKNIQYYLIVPFRKAWKINQYEFQNFKIKKIYIPLRGMNFLARKKLLPPLDLLFGPGVYVFPEFIRLPLLFSKSITMIYDAVFKVIPESVEPKMRQFLLANIEETIRHSTKLITISNSAKRDLSTQFNISTSSISVVKPSVDKTIFYPRSKNEVNKVRSKYELFDDYILAVGNLEPRKNIVKLFDAYTSLPEDIRKKYCLLLVGASSWNTKVIFDTHAAYKEQGYRIITRLGSVSDADMPAIFSGASLLVYPSLYEGFGMPIIEAMACGTPVLAGNNSSLPEAKGDASLTINETSTASIASAIESLLRDRNLWKYHRDKGFEHIDSIGTWVDAGAEFQNLIVSAQNKKLERLT